MVLYIPLKVSNTQANYSDKMVRNFPILLLATIFDIFMLGGQIHLKVFDRKDKHEGVYRKEKM